MDMGSSVTPNEDFINEYQIQKEGNLEEEGVDFQILPHLHGERDERVIHAGMPAVDDKCLISQWGYPGQYLVEKHPAVAAVTKPSRDGMYL